MLNFRRKISIFLCVSMVLVNVLPGFSEGIEFDVHESTSAEDVLDMIEENDPTKDYKSASESILESEDESTTEENLEEEMEDEPIDDTLIIEEPEEEVLDASISKIDDEDNTINEISYENEIEEDVDNIDDIVTSSDSEIETTDDIIISSDSEVEDEESSFYISSNSELTSTDDENLFLDATASEIIETFLSATESDVYKTLDITSASISEADEEIKNYGFIPIDITVPKTKKLLMNSFKSSLPSQYDSRSKNNTVTGLSYVPEVRNQGDFGTCWAFSTLGMMETSIRKKGLATSDEESDLSEAALSYFYFHLNSIYDANKLVNMGKPGVQGEDYVEIVGENPSPNPGSNNWSQIGGNQYPATLFISGYAGAVIEEDGIRYSDMGSSGSPGSVFSGIDKKYAYNSNSYVINNVRYINNTDTNEIKQAIIDNGSVGIAYCENGSVRNEGNNYYYKSNIDSDSANHAVMVVGWDDTISKTKFPNGASHDGGWLVRNSWGTSSRDSGYFWMSYDEPSFYETVFSIDAIKADTYKYNYHYDTTGITFTVPQLIKRAGNIYKVSSDTNQRLEAISFPFGTTNVNYKISVYTSNSAMTNPNDGTLVTTQTGKTTVAGIYTIPLNTKVLLKKGTYFSVVVSSNTGSLFGTFVDCSADAGILKFYNYQLKKQTFGDTGSGWVDDITSGDPYHEFDFTFRIKALTNPSFNVHFDMNGHGNQIADVTAVKNEHIKRPASPSVVGYDFLGWYKENTCINEWNFDTDVVLDNMTLYAKWNKKFTPIPIPSGGGGGSSGGGGGGGGGRASGGGLPSNKSNIVPKQEDAKIVPVRNNTTDQTVLASQVAWNYDPVKGTWTLKIDEVNSALPNTCVVLVSTDLTTGLLKTDTYRFDENGNMITGWVKDEAGSMYYFDANKGADEGKMATGWKEIGTGTWYYFGIDGKMVVNSVTPDGVTVGADGSWHDQNAQIQNMPSGPGI